jgi:parvulin-like peptidyl-prolyl isomerase
MMIKKLLILVSISVTSFLAAQTATEKELEILKTTEDVESYLESKKSKKNKLITFNEEKHKTILAKELFKLGKGGTKINESEFEKTFYKIVTKNKNTYYRAAYIYLDGTKYSVNEIERLREKIILHYKNGTPFDFLAKRYSLDKNANKGGDTGWFLEGEMHPDFEDKVIHGNNINSIFTLNIPSENGFYVVLKTHKPKDISEIEVLKIVEDK